MTPRERWQKLVKASIVEINAIDADTEWKEYEPDWWLGMMDVRQLLIENEERESEATNG